MTFWQWGKKKLFVLWGIFILIFVLLFAGFLFIKKQIEFDEQFKGFTSSVISEYEIKDISNGNKLIENKPQGFSAEIPGNWNILKYAASDDIELSEVNELLFTDPSIAFDSEGDIDDAKVFKEKGACAIGMTIMNFIEHPRFHNELFLVSKQIEAFKTAPDKIEESSKDTLIKISDKYALKSITKGKADYPRSIEVDVPREQTLFKFYSALVFNSKCIDEFNRFLETIIIK